MSALALAPSPPSDVSYRLKHETRAAHDAIEANPKLQRLLAPDYTRAEYADLLARLLPFHLGVERQIENWLIAERAVLHLARRRKASLLRADLSALGCSEPTTPAFAEPLAQDAASAWGVLYVMEGASLGGRVILKHIQASLGVSADHGAAYYAGYGEATGPMWQAFRARLTGVAAARPDWVAPIIAAAGATFAAMDAWIGLD